MNAAEPQGRRPRRLTIGRIGVYAFLATSALFFLLPLWIMIVTSLKPMEEIRLGNILALPAAMTFDAWIKAWSSACTGLECNGISVGFWNSTGVMRRSRSMSYCTHTFENVESTGISCLRMMPSAFVS